jgi:hypothetical protein
VVQATEYSGHVDRLLTAWLVLLLAAKNQPLGPFCPLRAGVRPSGQLTPIADVVLSLT